jgi:hypothetical protein
VNWGLHLKLPVSEAALVDHCFNVLSPLFKRVPSLLREDFRDVMVALIGRSPKKAMVLLAMISESFSMLETPVAMLELLFSCSRLFFREALGAELVSVLFHLLAAHRSFRRAKMEECQLLFGEGLQCSDTRAIQMSYNALCVFSDDSVVFDIAAVSGHLSNPEIRDSALGFLAKLGGIPVSQLLISRLIAEAFSCKEATLVLMKAAQSRGNAKMIIEAGRWIGAPFPTLQYSLELFLLLLGHKSFLLQLQNAPRVPDLFAELCREQNPLYIETISVILVRLRPTREFLHRLMQLKTLRLILETVVALGDNVSATAGFKIVEMCARIEFTSDYFILADLMKSYLERSRHCQRAVVALSRYPLCAKRFVSLDMVPYFKRLASSNEDAATFMKNIDVCRSY